MKLNYQSIFIALLFMGAATLTSCSGSDDDGNNDGGKTKCEYCFYAEGGLTGHISVNGQGYHTPTQSVQFGWSTDQDYDVKVPWGSIQPGLHKDGGENDVKDHANISITMFSYNGYTMMMKVGDSFNFDPQVNYNTDNVSYFYIKSYTNPEQITFSQYVSGSVKCIKAEGRDRTLSFNDLILMNRKTNEKVTLNGTIVCRLDEKYDVLYENWEKWAKEHFNHQ